MKLQILVALVVALQGCDEKDDPNNQQQTVTKTPYGFMPKVPGQCYEILDARTISAFNDLGQRLMNTAAKAPYEELGNDLDLLMRGEAIVDQSTCTDLARYIMMLTNVAHAGDKKAISLIQGFGRAVRLGHSKFTPSNIAMLYFVFENQGIKQDRMEWLVTTPDQRTAIRSIYNQISNLPDLFKQMYPVSQEDVCLLVEYGAELLAKVSGATTNILTQAHSYVEQKKSYVPIHVFGLLMSCASLSRDPGTSANGCEMRSIEWLATHSQDNKLWENDPKTLEFNEQDERLQSVSGLTGNCLRLAAKSGYVLGAVAVVSPAEGILRPLLQLDATIVDVATASASDDHRCASLLAALEGLSALLLDFLKEPLPEDLASRFSVLDQEIKKQNQSYDASQKPISGHV